MDRSYGPHACDFVLDWFTAVPPLWKQGCSPVAPARPLGMDRRACIADEAVPLPPVQRQAFGVFLPPPAFEGNKPRRSGTRGRIIKITCGKFDHYISSIAMPVRGRAFLVTPAPRSSARMCFVEDLKQLPNRSVRIPLRGGQRRMAQQLLNRAQVRAVGQ